MVTKIEDLEKTACLYWPKHLSSAAASISTLPVLLETQDKFLSILKSSDQQADSWRHTLVHSSTLSASLFLKHLMVLSDIGGERLQRFSKDFDTLFPKGEMVFVWNGKKQKYSFLSKGKKNWTNTYLNVEKNLLLEDRSITDDMIDVIMILLYGSSIIDSHSIPQEIRDKCTVGQLLGQPAELELFVKQRYLFVSRITGGSTANDMGHLCEVFVREFMEKRLPGCYRIAGHTIEGISHNDKDLTTFDLIITNIENNKCCAIEISFQVTTNSVIERKSGLAKSRQELLHSVGHKVAYIIDGSGNFQRRNAISTILQFSDYAVNFSDEGLQKLLNFIIQNV